MSIRTVTYFLCLLLLHRTAYGQGLSFHHLNTTHGLSDNNVNAVTTDKNGFLWIGTSNGLNLYDGRTLTVFKTDKTPELASDIISGLICDSRNRIWVGTVSGVTMIDEQRIFHRIVLADTLRDYDAKTQVDTRSYGVIILSNKGHFYFNEKNNKWELLKFSGDIIMKEYYADGVMFSPDSLLVVAQHKAIFMVDYRNKKEVLRVPLRYVNTACRLNDSAIFASDVWGGISVVNIRTAKIEKTMTLDIISQGAKRTVSVIRMRNASDNRIIITTRMDGIFIYDPITGQFAQLKHEVHDPQSLPVNQTASIHCEENGSVFITTRNNGLAYFNIYPAAVKTISYFTDRQGNIFDVFVNMIRKDRNGDYWIAAFDRLIHWDPQTNLSTYYYYYYPVKNLPDIKLEIVSVCIDNENKVWVSTSGGIGLLNKNTGKFEIFDNGFVNKDSLLKSNNVRDLTIDRDGFIWAISNRGVYRINPSSKKFEDFKQHPLLRQLFGKSFLTVYADGQDNIWFGGNDCGIYHWNRIAGTLKNYSIKNKLPSNDCYSLLQTATGDIYAGTPKGMAIIRNDSVVKIFTKDNGLRLNRCEGLLEDDAGNIWIGNDDCIICFNPAGQSFRYFDEKAGLSGYGFRTRAFLKTEDGTQFWGSEKGLNYFKPEKLLQLNTNPNPVIVKITVGDSIRFIPTGKTITVPFKNNNVIFHFASVNVFGGRDIFYQYQLEGADKKWNSATDASEVRYNALKPGNYIFQLKASADGVNWVNSKYDVRIKVLSPFWQTTWFLLIIIATIILLATILYRRRISYIKQQQSDRIEKLKIKQANAEKELLLSNLNHDLAVTKLTALRVQMNPHFIFNALNSIQQMVLRREDVSATKYLSKFSKLLRIILLQSDKTTVPVNEELEILNLYLELEALRYSDSFEYSVTVDDMIDKDETEVPTLLIQPFVENAIWHGLLHKQGLRKLFVHFGLNNNEQLVCTIDDNGIGREAAAKIFENEIEDNQHTGKGIKAAEERLQLFNQEQRTDSQLEIIDKKDENGNATGTTIIVTLPEIN